MSESSEQLLAEARAEAERIITEEMPAEAIVGTLPFKVGFIEGVAWQASRKVEVTDEMVERAVKSLADDELDWDACGREGVWLDNFYASARAALSAALGGGDHG